MTLTIELRQQITRDTGVRGIRGGTLQDALRVLEQRIAELERFTANGGGGQFRQARLAQLENARRYVEVLRGEGVAPRAFVPGQTIVNSAAPAAAAPPAPAAAVAPASTTSVVATNKVAIGAGAAILVAVIVVILVVVMRRG